jgi:hypothetical protein
VKGVFLPTKTDCYLQRIVKSFRYSSKKDNEKNAPKDVDIEIWSLQYFIYLLGKGDTNALDLLHAPIDSETTLLCNKVWKNIYYQRSSFYTKQFPGLLGYARKQASKYGDKGTRLAEIKKVIKFLHLFSDGTRIKEIWDTGLPEGQHIFINNTINEDKPYRTYEICGRQFQETVTVKYVYDAIKKIVDEYGSRAIKAEKNEGLDWKAISHAVRAGYQIIDLYTTGDIIWPLKESDFIFAVKQGEKHFAKEVAPVVDELVKTVEILAEESNYPNNINKKYWDNYIVQLYEISYKDVYGGPKLPIEDVVDVLNGEVINK